MIQTNHFNNNSLNNSINQIDYIRNETTSYYKLKIYQDNNFIIKCVQPLNTKGYIFALNEYNFYKNVTGIHIPKCILPEKSDEEYIFKIEYIQGFTLSNLDTSCISERNKLFLSFEIVSALKNIFDQEFTHGDLKPDNIIIDPKGDIKIIDFEFSTNLKTFNSYQFYFGGTFPYILPKILKSHKTSFIYTPKVLLDNDIYALLNTIHYIYTEKLFYNPSTIQELIKMQSEYFPIINTGFDYMDEILVKTLNSFDIDTIYLSLLELVNKYF